MGEWIDAVAAAERLGVKPATLYAYVSRGVLRRRRDADGRRSLFDADEIEELARRGRPRRPPSPTELAIESAVTALGPDRQYYRGRDATELATTSGFEEVASWLWTGEQEPDERKPDEQGPAQDEPDGTWHAPEEGLAAAVAAQSGLPGDVLPLDRLQVITTALAAADPLRFQLDRAGVIATAHALIAGLVDALPAAGADADRTIAGRLWGRLSERPPEPGLLRAVGAAMVLLADHELAASTLAARVAASVRADPYAVVAVGLGTVGGPLHGGASFGAERMFAEIGEPGRAGRVIGERLRAGQRIPGFGHSVYRSGDRRATVLFDLIRQVAPDHPRLAVADTVRAEAARRRLPEPNVDLALATLTAVAGMPPGSGEAIFAVARTAGWIAHALEEYERASPLRPRAVYTGPPPPAAKGRTRH
ncbi:citrate/2-methylcitrate synthase [Actinomadura rudentiformis]|uniref:citrate synthase (unknown stereospecificity) n=1 Tax=Actinomadura rudentiformis TaxID=359158 RepID=A0A6H9YL37_9ACTN|nr:citrate/2-methylcitrate synthase [Actinomadura rudentiformis]KAB2345255.1 citrate/2-methylcitrate synthase [Actinomadura rudentiformis]